jgi:pyruvate dehydrogenase E2 component (dihydrolipoamide acetyltransferase)
MIKYVELTAPEASAFRQAKILSIECKEGKQIKEGDTLFRVQSGAHKINLPATKAGRIVELIVELNENITLSTALLLLETEVEGSTASKPINIDNELQPAEPSSGDAKEIKGKKKNQQKASKVLNSKIIAKKTEQPKPQVDTDQKVLKDTTTVTKNHKKVVKKKHKQQSLDLEANDLFESKDSSKKQQADINEVVLTQRAAPAAAKVKDPSQPSLTMTSSSIIEVTVPDIGADSAKVIEIFVSVGDTVSIDDPLITLESDKASMDVPSPHNGVVKSISVTVDDDIGEGTLILELESGESVAGQAKAADKQDQVVEDQATASQEKQTPRSEAKTESDPGASAKSESNTQIVEVRIPDIGGDSAKVIELLVAVGDKVEVEDSLLTLESDKASMDVPSSAAGVIKSIEVNVDEDVSEGTLVVTLMVDNVTHQSSAADSSDQSEETETEALTKSKLSDSTRAQSTAVKNTSSDADQEHVADTAKSHASPSIRRFARELGVSLTNISGSGRKGRITHDDVKGFVKTALSTPAKTAQATSTGTGIPQVPAQDFSKFGEIDIQPLNKIKRLTAENLHRSWLNVPHVTHSDEANISDLESFRKQLNAEYQQQKRDIKLSPLAFIVKAVVNGLRLYPQFNSSLEPGGQNLIYKKYFNIGIAVETPNGLVVPVLRDADKKSVAEIAKEMGDLAKKARDKKLTMKDMSGACITISSLGGIGGTGFTPIVNAPEVAILGVSRSKMQPVWNGTEFQPGMVLPLSLSYDHRVIDGAEAARFTRHIAAVLEDVRRLTV